jgi:hypothetical protein
MDILRAVQGLNIGSIKPLCPDHKPTGQYVRLPDDLGGGITYEVTCPNCNLRMLVHPTAVADLLGE